MFRKQKEAEDDFMHRHDHEILELPTGQGLVIRRWPQAAMLGSDEVGRRVDILSVGSASPITERLSVVSFNILERILWE
jgi:hypothetical protein